MKSLNDAVFVHIATAILKGNTHNNNREKTIDEPKISQCSLKRKKCTPLSQSDLTTALNTFYLTLNTFSKFKFSGSENNRKFPIT